MTAPLRRIARLTLRESRVLLSNRTFWAMAAAPLLFGVVIVVVGIVATVLVSLVQVAQPEVNPLGTGNVGVVTAPLEPAAEEALMSFLEIAPSLSPRGQATSWVQRVRAWTRVVRGAPPLEPGEDPVNSGQALRFERWQGDITQARARIPTDADAVLHVEQAGGRLAYRVVHEQGLLASRIMARRLNDLIGVYNRQGTTAAPRVQIAANHAGPVDLWGVQLLLLLWALSTAYSYYSVAVQSVAALLAGERENRTLEVVLALPLEAREVVLGKLLALTLATLIPSTFWIGIAAVGVEGWLGVSVPLAKLLLAALLLVLPLMAVGCFISATAPTTVLAKNRLGLANLVVVAAATGGVFLATGLHPQGVSPLAGAALWLAGAPGGGWWGLGGAALSLGVTALLVEGAARGLKATG